MKTILVPLFALALAGCATQITTADLAKCGTPPTRSEERTKAYVEAQLRDPESARYHFLALKRSTYRDGLIEGGGVHYGWVQEVEVNAKNGFGGYEGFQTYYVFFEGGGMPTRSSINGYLGTIEP